MPTLPPPPIREVMNNEDGSMTRSWNRWFTLAQSQLQTVNVANPQYDYITAEDGFDYTFQNDISTLIIDGTDVQTGTVTCPANPFPGQIIRVSPTIIVNNFTVAANAGQKIKGGAASLAPGVVIAYTYRAENNTWYPT